jgi:hypothetical protein
LFGEFPFPTFAAQYTGPLSILMEATRFRRFFGALLTLLGIAVLLFACIAFLSDEPVLGLTVTKWESVVPFLVGAVFLSAGVNLVGRS